MRKLKSKVFIVTNSDQTLKKPGFQPPSSRGTPVDLPKDLYIPPEALKVFLEAFEGPLDLLLYLIKRQNIDICDIPIAEVTRQYMEYIDLMKQLKWELAAEYLVMAAILAQIKSQILLPRPKNQSEDESEMDPRQELIQKLQEYEQFKKAAQDIDQLPRIYRDIFPVSVLKPQIITEKKHPQVTLEEMLSSLLNLLNRAEKTVSHRIKMETLSVREKMVFLIQKLVPDRWLTFHELLKREEGIEGVVVTLIAILELLRQQSIEITQSDCLNDFQCRKL